MLGIQYKELKGTLFISAMKLSRVGIQCKELKEIKELRESVVGGRGGGGEA